MRKPPASTWHREPYADTLAYLWNGPLSLHARLAVAGRGRFGSSGIVYLTTLGKPSPREGENFTTPSKEVSLSLTCRNSSVRSSAAQWNLDPLVTMNGGDLLWEFLKEDRAMFIGKVTRLLAPCEGLAG